MKLRYKLLIAIGLWGWLYWMWNYHRPLVQEEQSKAVVLPKKDKEQILVNPFKHTITLVTATKTQTLTLPDRVSTIDLHTNNTINVTLVQYGFEERPFVGIQASNHFRFMAGSDQFFYKKLDLGLAIGVQPDLASIVGIVQISYEVWSNTKIGLTFDTDKHIGTALSVRL